MFRPTLQMLFSGPRSVEDVSISYPPDTSFASFTKAMTASVSVGGQTGRTGTSKYVRAWVSNQFGFPAHRCQVMVDGIFFEGNPLETEGSPHHWTDFKDAFEYPMLRYGYRNGWYVNICAADSIDPRLQILSLKWTKGYHRFGKTGIYRIELTAEAMKPCSFGHLILEIFHDKNDWKKLSVISAKPGRLWSRWW